MIVFENIHKEIPFLIFKEKYDAAFNAGQKNIEAICISSYSSENKEVHARYVNLKFVKDKEFIFFSNYNSPKSRQFKTHNQITALIYWSSINAQIRMKAHVDKTSINFNQAYFAKRDQKKNALAISSKQSSAIDSYEVVKKNFEHSFKHSDLTKCPDYWGGYSFTPYFFEFWDGHELRINKRETYECKNGEWIHSFLQP